MTTAASTLAEFAVGLRLEEIPAPVREAAKLHLLDTLGCGLAAHALDEGTYARSVAADAGGAAEATVLGWPERLPAPAASLANATLCHALDFDDTHGTAGCHISVVVGPACLAAGEAAGASGAELLVALVAASEVVARIGMSAPRAFHRRGFHPTSVCGVFGAAAAAARLAGLDAAAATSALGLAGSFAGGLFAYLDDGTPTKPIHPGMAAQGGLLAARFAAAGAIGPQSVLEGRYGFLAAYAETESHDLDRQVADLGDRWETPASAYKAYPACHATHGCLGAAEELAGDGLDPDAVREVVVSIAPPDVPVVLEPFESKVRPRSVYEAKFSLPYSVAAMLAHGQVGIATYTPEAIRDEGTLALAAKVRYETVDFPTHPASSPGGVRVVLEDGRTLERTLAESPGSIGNPLSPAAVRAKFEANASLALDADGVTAVAETILALEHQPDARAAVRGLA